MAPHLIISETMLLGSLWGFSPQAKILWITMMLMRDEDDRVDAAVCGLAARAHLSTAETEEALAELLAPDPYSECPDFDGRRIEVCDRGWRMLVDRVLEARAADGLRRQRMSDSQKRWRSARRANAEVAG